MDSLMAIHVSSLDSGQVTTTGAALCYDSFSMQHKVMVFHLACGVTMGWKILRSRYGWKNTVGFAVGHISGAGAQFHCLTYSSGQLLIPIYIFRSIHNVRIERLWVDVTAQVGATWSDHFTILELHHGLDINNVNHIWLLHYLFLPTINDQLTFFMGAWNEHRIQIRNGPNRSPADLFGFDMLVHGARGHALVDESFGG